MQTRTMLGALSRACLSLETVFMRAAVLVMIATLAFLGSSPATAQTITEFALNTPAAMPFGIAAGPDGALWFVTPGSNKVVRMTTSGTFADYPLPTANSAPQCIVAGADGAMWFVEGNTNRIGRITTAGVISEFQLSAGGWPQCLTVGPDGALWVANQGPQGGGAATGDGWVERVTTGGVVTKFPVPTPDSQVDFIAAGSDGALWFTYVHPVNKIGRITTAGVVTEFAVPTTNAGLGSITAGPDGALWFTELLASKIGRIATDGTITEFPVTANSNPFSITAGPDGALWFTQPGIPGNIGFTGGGQKIGRITTSGVLTEYAIPTANSAAGAITVGPDGLLWFTESAGNNIAKITLSTAPGNSIVGGWYLNGQAGSVAGTSSAKAFTFTSDGKYYLADDDSTVLDPSGQSGMEYGSYTWDASTGAFTHATTTDTNGQWGMSNSICKTAAVSGNTLTLTCADASNPAVFSSTTLTRAISPSNPIVGSWYVGTPTSNRIFTFLDDGTYLSAANEDPALDPTGQKGMERGTYTWNASSGAFATVTTVNTDGQWGFSQSICKTAVVVGDTATLSCADTSSPTAFGSFSMARVAGVAPSVAPIPSAPAPTAPLPPPPTAQTAYTVATGQLPTAAVSVDLKNSTYGNATLVVTLDLSKVLAGGSFAGLGQFAAGYNVYVVALVPGTVLGLGSATFFMLPKPPGSWGLLGSPIAAYIEGLAQNATNRVEITILEGLNVISLVGTEIYIGYGTSDTEMLTAGRYRGVYKVQ